MSSTYTKKKPESIQEMFNSIAPTYDLTNSILSMQMHKLWNRKLIKKTFNPKQPDTFLDLCCGTGAIGLDYLNRTTMPVKGYMIDFSASMLAEAKKRASAMDLDRHEVEFIEGDAQAIPIPNDSVKYATIAYGIRNVKSPQACIKETYRVLTPGGTLGILELTQPENGALRFLHGVYLRNALPLVGKLFTNNGEAYKYLSTSIKGFIPPKELQLMMFSAGFKNVKRIPLLGGIATILIGTKP
jgi:demethylmenaquinone methyltransferase/2-methoxy-6-polyprenyl-1,4-benzoquinol methylase